LLARVVPPGLVARARACNPRYQVAVSVVLVGAAREEEGVVVVGGGLRRAPADRVLLLRSTCSCRRRLIDRWVGRLAHDSTALLDRT
jgi:hypothetical protein